MKALDLLKTILENGLSSYNEEDDTVLVNGWWVTLEECIAELEALQSRSCCGCRHGEYHDETSTYCKEYVREKTFNLANPNDFYCKHFKPKEQ